MRAELTHNAGGPREFPSDGLPEIALLGRSNVGKSSLINALVGRRSLARTSNTPGRTRRVHFYRVEEVAYLVDLPGYGYAKVAKSERASWRKLAESYLRGSRETLKAGLLLIDARRDVGDLELGLIEWLHSQAIPVRVALVKADTLGRGRAQSRALSLARELPAGVEAVAAVSAHGRIGLDVLARWIEEWLGLVLLTAEGKPLAGAPTLVIASPEAPSQD